MLVDSYVQDLDVARCNCVVDLQAATPVASPSQPPFTPLVLAVAVTFLANETELIQNFTNALQNTPQAVFFSVVAADGQVWPRFLFLCVSAA